MVIDYGDCLVAQRVLSFENQHGNPLVYQLKVVGKMKFEFGNIILVLEGIEAGE